MARQVLKIKVTFHETIETNNWLEEFAEENELGEDAEIDQVALAEFALAKFQEQLEEGDISYDSLDDSTIDSVTA